MYGKTYSKCMLKILCACKMLFENVSVFKIFFLQRAHVYQTVQFNYLLSITNLKLLLPKLSIELTHFFRQNNFIINSNVSFDICFFLIVLTRPKLEET